MTILRHVAIIGLVPTHDICTAQRVKGNGLAAPILLAAIVVGRLALGIAEQLASRSVAATGKLAVRVAGFQSSDESVAAPTIANTIQFGRKTRDATIRRIAVESGDGAARPGNVQI